MVETLLLEHLYTPHTPLQQDLQSQKHTTLTKPRRTSHSSMKRNLYLLLYNANIFVGQMLSKAKACSWAKSRKQPTCLKESKVI